MKKRRLRKEVKAILAGLLVVLCAFTFSACTKEKKEEDNNVINPWVEVETIDEAINKAGFTSFDLPEKIDNKEITYIAVLDSEYPEVEVVYGDEITIRKAVGDSNSDLSGDYSEYKVTEIHDGEDISFTVKGDGETFNNITWSKGEYAYSIYTSNGLSIETINEIVNIIK